MRDVSAVRGLEAPLKDAGVKVLLLNIHDAVGSALLERFAFRSTPTYLLFDVGGDEVWRSHQLLTFQEMLIILVK